MVVPIIWAELVSYFNNQISGSNMITAKYITEISITDPDSNTEVQPSIYKEVTGGLFALDSSFIEQVFSEEDQLIIDSPFGNGKVILND